MPAEVDSNTTVAGASRRAAASPRASPARTAGRDTVTQTTHSAPAASSLPVSRRCSASSPGRSVSTVVSHGRSRTLTFTATVRPHAAWRRIRRTARVVLPTLDALPPTTTIVTRYAVSMTGIQLRCCFTDGSEPILRMPAAEPL